MELTNNYSDKANATGLRPLVKRIIMKFVNQHSGVFEALSRMGTPYGDNCLPSRKATAGQSPPDEDQLGYFRHQLDTLNSQVARLNEKVDSIRPVENFTKTIHRRSAVKANEIGINRFRALQTK